MNNDPKRPSSSDQVPRSRAAEAIHRRIQGLVRSLLSRHDQEAIAGLPESLELQLRIPIRLDRDDHRDSRRFSSSLLAQIESLRIQGETESLGHRAGHAPCFWCDSPVCEHSRPPDQRSVLVGWSTTGIPLWKEVASILLDEGDEQIDLLYGDETIPVICWRSEESLLGEVLPEYLDGSHFSRPIGALICGGFPLPGSTDESACVTALILESRAGRVVPRYSLNLLSRLPAPHHIETIAGDHSRSILSRWIGSLRANLHRHQQDLITAASNGQRPSLRNCREGVVDLLIESRSHLKTLRRRSSRRTHHAQLRSDDPNRPTSVAVADLLSSSAQDLYRDRRESTIVAKGPQGRIHIFTTTGRHITSAIYSAESTQNRILRSRWIPLTASDAARFIEMVNRTTRSQKDGSRPAEDAS